MRKFYKAIIGRSKLVLIIFGVAFLGCVVFGQMVSVNYEMQDYLPKDSTSTISLDIMHDEFDDGIFNARVMVRDVTNTDGAGLQTKNNRNRRSNKYYLD